MNHSVPGSPFGAGCMFSSSTWSRRAPPCRPCRGGQPLLGVAGREAQALGGAVVLVDDRPPPIDHLLLDLHRAGRGGVDRASPATTRRTWRALRRQLEHPPEHRRHQLAVARPVLLDELQVQLRVEVLHDDGRAAVPDGEATARAAPSGTAAPARGRSCPRGNARARPRTRTPAAAAPAASRAAAARCLSACRWCPTNTASPCRAIRRRSACPGKPAVASSRLRMRGSVTRTVDDQRHLDIRALLQRLGRHRALLLGEDQHLRLAVVDDVGDLVGRQKRVDAGVVQPRTLAGRAAFEVARVVLHEDRVVIQALEPDDCAGSARGGWTAPRVRRRSPPRRCGHDERRLIRPVLNVRACVHEDPPWSQHSHS